MYIDPRSLPLLPGDAGLIDLIGSHVGDDAAPSFSDLLVRLHRAMTRREELAGVVRIAVATYEADTDMVKTFASTDAATSLLQRHQCRLASVPSLQSAADTRIARNLTDLCAAGPGQTPHMAMLRQAGVRASLAIPIHWHDDLAGFVFFDSAVANYFTQGVRDWLWPYAHLIALMLANEQELVRIIRGAAKTAQELARYRDPETGAHLQRMARFARLVAEAMAPRLALSDEFVEYLFWFAPLHDVGKVAIPDSILLKPGPLDPAEYVEMQRHVQYGIEIVDRMSGNFGLTDRLHVTLMRNVIGCHHECVDGSGYPAGLKGAAIPIEGRITAVADVFDALTSVRPYKPRWDNDRALTFLRDNRGTRFDPDCVDALAADMAAVCQIQAQFADAPAA